MFQSIQACRALAAILVVCFHLAGNLAKDKYFGSIAAPLERLFVFGGSAGVAFFFVLSGFIITHVHRADFGHPRRLGSYLRKRIARIYPTYLVVFAGVYLTAILVPSLRDAMPTDAAVLVKSLLLLPQDPAVVGGTGAPVIVVAWSLQYEVVFYVLVALAIVHPLLSAAAVALFAANFIWHSWGGAREFPASFFANELMLLFAMGVGAAAVGGAGWRMPKPLLVATAAGVLFFAVGAASIWRHDPHNTYFNFGYGICGAVAIVALIQAEREHPARFENRTLFLLGDASYAIYLIHFPLIAVLCKLALAAGLSGVSGMLVAFVGIGLACVAVSVLFHLWIERPMLRLVSRRGTRRPVEPAASECATGG